VVRLAFFKEREQVGSGSAFLTRGLLITNSHVIRGGHFDAMEVTFGDHDINPVNPIRLPQDAVFRSLRHESLEDEYDHAVLDICGEPEFCGRHQFELGGANTQVRIGEQVVFFGFPFGSRHVTAHVGYISSDFRDGGIRKLQIDGSINYGNSGGPLLHMQSGKVVGIVTRTQLGLEADYDELVAPIANNEKILAQQPHIMSLGGIDPVDATRVTMTILRKVATNMKRSGNVGIGYAFSTEHLRAGIEWGCSDSSLAQGRDQE
jgi:hypothetical protein